MPDKKYIRIVTIISVFFVASILIKIIAFAAFSQAHLYRPYYSDFGYFIILQFRLYPFVYIIFDIIMPIIYRHLWIKQIIKKNITVLINVLSVLQICFGLFLHLLATSLVF